MAHITRPASRVMCHAPTRRFSRSSPSPHAARTSSLVAAAPLDHMAQQQRGRPEIQPEELAIGREIAAGAYGVVYEVSRAVPCGGVLAVG